MDYNHSRVMSSSRNDGYASTTSTYNTASVYSNATDSTFNNGTEPNFNLGTDSTFNNGATPNFNNGTQPMFNNGTQSGFQTSNPTYNNEAYAAFNGGVYPRYDDELDINTALNSSFDDNPTFTYGNGAYHAYNGALNPDVADNSNFDPNQDSRLNRALNCGFDGTSKSAFNGTSISGLNDNSSLNGTSSSAFINQPKSPYLKNPKSPLIGHRSEPSFQHHINDLSYNFDPNNLPSTKQKSDQTSTKPESTFKKLSSPFTTKKSESAFNHAKIDSPSNNFGRRWGSSRSTPGRVKRLIRHRNNGDTSLLDIYGLIPHSDSHVMRELLVRQDNGLEMAFERCKAWSKYASHLLQFVRSRLVMEHEHARNVAKLAEQTKNLLYADANNNPLPLVGVFDELMESQVDMTTRTEHLVNLLNQRFIATLENRQKDHDHKRRKLKNEWTKQKKQLEQCEEELRRARQNLNMKEGGYMKARDHMIRQVQSVPSRPVVDANRQKKEIEKRRRNEETALNRKTEAENEVWKLERELDERRRAVQELRLITIDELCDLIRHCDLTTTACASHYVKAFADLWTLLPQEYNRLAHAIRESSPGSEYMSFLQSLPGRSISSASLLRGSTSTAGGGDKPDEDFANSSLSMATSSGESAPSSARRRNALNAEEHIDYIAETSSRRQKKTRIFDQSLNHVEQSDAAKSHQLQRTRQVTRCAHCEHLVIFDAVKCTICGIVWHKKCLPLLSVVCGPSAHRLTAESAGNRRMSIFGVPLIGHLQAQRRQVPIILEKCIDELQKRGMNCKGLYRTCGVKSKIEQICVQFEQAGEDANVDLSEVHPMNLASVVKLYLRKLPEPLMTYELYKDWLDVDTSDIAESKEVLKGLCDRLPQQNYDTFKFLLMHLRRVSWFELENLMTPANLAAVISPSLIWNRSSNTGPSTPTSFSSSSTGTGAQNSFINDAHQQTKIVEHLIQYVYDIFEDDMSADWKKFFEAYPDVEEPKQADPETEAKLTKDSAKPEFTLDDEDELNDYDIDDEAQGSIQELSLPEANFPMPRNSFASPSTCRLPGTAGDKHKLGKQRSFTTSILVSPQSDRKVILNSNKPSYSDRKLSEDQTQRTLKSGEVVVEIRKNQYCMPEYNAKGSTEAGRDSRKSSGQSHLNRNFGGSTLAISGDFPHVDDDVDEEPGRQRSATSRRASAHKPDDERVCLQNVGVIFSGNDVSYV
ncbi:unnamed protein product [Bursaphelenchus okinawaensis]|uniref:Rho-GAP domain-containing protein n=1 Tax=Bursaphelenchus okinawaensis TaxID=465554 RepID=A0A811K375_9BILA|nr:unnamed protein product [Bursaphelenchus okinawaensis]CAG9090731.1 unnamed protein product [Bursaphelenchus okinawaensis]